MRFRKQLQESTGYALAKPFELMKKLEQQGIQCFDLTLGDPKLDTAPPAKQAAIAALEKAPYYGYPPAKGTPSLRQAFCSWAKRIYGAELNADSQCLSSNGSKEAIFSLPLLFEWDSEATIAVPTPAYPVYEDSANFLGINVDRIKLSWEQGYLAALSDVPVEVYQRCQLFWVNYPHNPTGAGASKEFFTELLELAEKHDFLVAGDECYHDMYFEQKPSSLLEFQDSQRWIVLRSLSKRSHMTGYRSGMICSQNEEIISLLAKLRAPMGVSTPGFIQLAAEAAWNDEVHVEANRQAYIDKRQRLSHAMEALNFEIFPSQAGFYLWCRHKAELSSEDIYAKFIEKGLIITRGSAFDSQDKNSVRLVYCFNDDYLNGAIERIDELAGDPFFRGEA